MNKILIVDDHAMVRLLIRLALGESVQVLEAEDGVSALEMVRKERPDLVVLDIMMPGELDGLQVLDAIRQDETLMATPVIMVSARGQARDKTLGMNHGADAYFTKPFSPMQLSSTIHDTLASRAQPH
ncbi:MAG: response regulator transcription factor [Rhodoferax sp.]